MSAYSHKRTFEHFPMDPHQFAGFCSVRLARIALPRASAICLCACHKCARRVAFRLEPTTTPAEVASRRVDLKLIKEAEAQRGGAPASTYGR